MPLFTVGIPTYNRPEFLQRAISSVLAQTCGDFELIVIDDASLTEHTRRVTERFSDERIRYFRNEENKGIAANINRVFSEAGGEYIGFLGDDDVFTPNLLEHLSGIIREKSKYEWIAFNLSMVSEKGDVLCDNYFNISHDVVFKQYHYIEHHFGSRQKFHIPGTFFVRKEFLKRNKIAYRPEVRGIDVFFSLEANCYTDIYIVAEPLYIHTRHALQESHYQNRPLEWKLQYYSGLYNLLTKHHLDYLTPLLRRCFLPCMPQALMEIFAGGDKERILEQLIRFRNDFSWMEESHPDFLKINLFNQLLEINVKGVSASEEESITLSAPPVILQEFYQWWFERVQRQRRGISGMLRERCIQTAAIFGTGFTGVMLGMDLDLEGIRLLAFLDNHRNSGYVNGVPVFPPAWLRDNPVDAVLISIERESPPEIEAQLKAILENRHIAIISWRSLAAGSIND